MFEKSNAKPSYVVVDRAPLSEKELAGAFAWTEHDPKVLAFLQLIGELEREAISQAIYNVGNTPVAASNIGGVEVLGELRDRFLALREKGFGTLADEK